MTKATRFRPHREAFPASRRRTIRPVLEHLEDRTVPAAEFIKNQLLVQYLPNVSTAMRTSVRTSLHARLAETIHTQAMIANGDGVMERWILPTGLNVNTAISRMAVTPFVRYAEPNWIYTTQVVSNDTQYTNGSLWGMYSDDSPTPVGPAGTTNQFGSWAEKAWNANVTGSSSVYVGIIDEGIQFNHPDLVNNMWVNPFETAGDGIDNDGNGYIDDIRGWDFFHNDNSTFDAADGDDHGSHVAGTIGAEGGNGQGVAGVNWDVTMITTKFLGPAGGSTAGAIKALDYLTDMKTRHGLNIVASNNSWGGGGFSQSLLDAIVRAARRDILFVAAAGNAGSNNDTTPSYPSNYNTTAGAGYDAVIAVASITNTGAMSGFSSFGATTVDLGAPGSGIVSTVPTNTYANFSGTSMATPHVTGAVALYASRYAGVSAQQLRTAILTSVTPTASLSGRTVTGGRLNVWNAINLPPFKPDITINDVSVTEGNSGTKTATLTVSLSGASLATVSVNWATKDGTATAPSDYVAGSGLLTFNPGETSKTINVTVNGDFLAEPNEDFTVALSNAINGNLVDDSGTVTILDDGDPKNTFISINDVTVTEGNTGVTNAVFTVSLSNAFGLAVTVDYLIKDGTAIGGSDFAPGSGTLTFAPGETTKTITVAINGDFLFENDETYQIILSNPRNASFTDDTGDGLILNDDFKDTFVTINDVSVVEGNSGRTSAVFTVSLSNAFGVRVTMDYLVKDGTATGGSDFVPGSGTLTFNPGETTKTITVFVNGDFLFENDEDYQVLLMNLNAGTFTDDTGVGIIINDDAKDVQMSINDVTVTEGNTGTTTATFTVTISSPFGTTVSADWLTKDLTAVAPGDYNAGFGRVIFSPGETSKTITVTVNGDLLFEPVEQYQVILQNPMNATIVDDTGDGFIIDDDPDSTTISISDTAVVEGNTGTTAMTFTVSLSNYFGEIVSVDYATRDGSATNPIDYNRAIGQVRFLPGETSKTVTVLVNGDTTVEPNEDLFVDLSNPKFATILDGTGRGVISNDDQPPVITVKIDDPSVVEGNAGLTAMVFTLTQNVVSDTDSYVNWSTSDLSATVANNDYIAGSGTAVIAAGSLRTQVTVFVVGDRTQEGNETFLVTLSPPTNVSILKFQGTGTIINDDGGGGGGIPPGGGGPPGLLQAEGGAVAGHASTLRQRDLNAIVRQAQSFWASAGLTQAQRANLANIQARVADLAGDTLGLANGYSILIDSNAAGYGWFIDATPGNNSEFTRPGNQGERNHMDLFSVVLHEMGHTLGLEHQDHGVMQATLASGSRDLGDLSHLLRTGTSTSMNPALDALFSQWQQQERSKVAAVLAGAVSRRV